MKFHLDLTGTVACSIAGAGLALIEMAQTTLLSWIPASGWLWAIRLRNLLNVSICHLQVAIKVYFYQKLHKLLRITRGDIVLLAEAIWLSRMAILEAIPFDLFSCRS